MGLFENILPDIYAFYFHTNNSTAKTCTYKCELRLNTQFLSWPGKAPRICSYRRHMISLLLWCHRDHKTKLPSTNQKWAHIYSANTTRQFIDSSDKLLEQFKATRKSTDTRINDAEVASKRSSEDFKGQFGSHKIPQKHCVTVNIDSDQKANILGRSLTRAIAIVMGVREGGQGGCFPSVEN